MKNVYVYPYKPGSKSAKLLAHNLDVFRIKHEESEFIGSKTKTVINWGCGNPLPEEVTKCRVLNKSRYIERSINKLAYFYLLFNSKVSIPDFTERYERASGWILNKDWSIVCRQRLEGHEGEGIVIADSVDQLVDAPLYTRFIPQTDEYRVNIYKDRSGIPEVFFVQKKVKERNANNNWRIRNTENGFVFSHNNVYPPKDVLRQAVNAFALSELDFGALDIIWNEEEEKAYVLEINTAPGIEGRMLHEYGRMFRRLIGE